MQVDFSEENCCGVPCAVGLFILFLGGAGSELMDFWQCWVNVWTRSERFFPPGWFHGAQPSVME